MPNLKLGNIRVAAAAAAAVTVYFAMAGCGGGGRSPAVDSAGSAVISITWPDRGRLIPLASNSLKVTFSLDGTVLQSKTVTRPASGNSSTVTFDSLKVGTLTLTAAAYPNADATGTAQAGGAASVVITSGQTANVGLTMQSTIDHMELTPAAPSVVPGGTVQMIATAKDASGAIVLVAPTKVHWDTADHGAATVSSTGLVTGVSTGATTVAATDTESGKGASAPLVVGATSLIAADSFEYAAGAELFGQNGGTGWTAPWSCHGPGSRSAIADTGLTFGSLRTNGLSSRTTSAAPMSDDRFVADTLGTPGTTLFISLLVRPLDPLGSGTYGSYLGTVLGNCFVGYTHGNGPCYGIERLGGGGWVGSTVQAHQGETAFLVVRFTFTGGNDIVDLFVNPTPGLPLPATPDASKSDLNLGTGNQLGFGGSTRCQFDEFRVGRTWEDVSPTTP